MKNTSIYSIIFASLIFTIVSLLLSCNSTDNKKIGKQSGATYKLLKYSSGNIKEKHKYENGFLSSIIYLDEDGFTDSIKKYQNGKLSSLIRYSYYQDGIIHTDTYKDTALVMHMVFDSVMNLLYQTPLTLPKVIHTTYKFRSGRTYFDKNKIDTIEIINNDIPPFNKGYVFNGVNSIRVNSFGVFMIQKFYQKKKTPDSLKILLTACQDISAKNQIRVKIDSIIIPVK